MATFVIVHGAWSGGHAWRWVRPLLRRAGHEVFTPALTGLGERSHLASAQVDLDTHIQDVLGVLEFEDLVEVVLVGHSSGGMVPTDGQCEFDLLAPEERAGYQQAATTNGQGWQVSPPVPEPLPEGLDAKLRWAMSRMVPQPINTFTQPLRMVRPAGAKIVVLCGWGLTTCAGWLNGGGSVVPPS